MKGVNILIVICTIILLAMGNALSENEYKAKIPNNYHGLIALHVDYGTTPDKIRVFWGSGTDDKESDGDPESVFAMRVINNNFYFIDPIAQTLKKFRSPGTFVWQTKKLDNLCSYAVAPDGKIYVVWGNGHEKLSCLDSQGKIMWTKSYFYDIFPSKKLKEFGLVSSYDKFESLDWTSLGLATVIVGEDSNNYEKRFAVLLDKDGNAVQALPGKLIGSDGVIYDYQSINKEKERFKRKYIGKDIKGNIVREIQPDYFSENLDLIGNPTIARIFPDPKGGIMVYSFGHLSSPIKPNSHQITDLEEIVWRFDEQGKLKEHWRFLGNRFASRASLVVVGSDGNIYYLSFGETGIDVIKYTPNTK